MKFFKSDSEFDLGQNGADQQVLDGMHGVRKKWNERSFKSRNAD